MRKLKKKKLSGSANRKRRRLQMAKAKGVAAHLIKLPNLDRLESLQDWRTQIAWLYRRALKGEIPEYLATKLTYIACAGANFAKGAEELRHLEEIKEQLGRIGIGGNAVITHQPVDDDSQQSLEGEYVESAE